MKTFSRIVLLMLILLSVFTIQVFADSSKSENNNVSLFASVRSYLLEWMRMSARPIIQKDTIPPAGTIKIDNGQPYTNSTVVRLSLSALDNQGGSGIDKMAFSVDNHNWTSPELYNQTKVFRLPSGDGTKTIYVKFSDKAGNWSAVYSGSIILDTIPPKLSILTPKNGTIVHTPNIAVNYTVDGTRKSQRFALRKAQNTVTVTESDPAGNIATASVQIMLTYVITSQAYPGGNIIPSGDVSVNTTGSQLFTITPRTGFGISDVLVDGISQGAISNYTFSNVTTNHTISAKFLANAPSNLLTRGLSATRVQLTWTDNANNQAGWMVQKSTNGVNFMEEALIVPAGLDVVATSISTGTLTLGAGSTVTIAAIPGGPGGPSVGTTPPLTDGPTVILSKPFSASSLTTGGTSTYTFNNLTPGQTYYFRVGAVKVYDGPSSYLNSSAATYVNRELLSSIVTTSGYRLILQKRKSDNTLEPAVPFVIKGVNWCPASIGNPGPNAYGGENLMRAEFSNWCDTDMPLMGTMNANAIRTFQDFGLTGDYPKDWKYILDKCYANNIMVIVTVDRCIADEARVRNIVTEYKDHPAILMWLVGNEWPIWLLYGAYPDIYSCADAVERCAQLIKTIDTNHPVATSIGDINAPSDATIKDIVENRCPSVDVWGFNIYRGKTFTSLFDQWSSIALEYKQKPMFLCEFGCDAYDINADQEDQVGQRTYEYYQWQDISKHLSADSTAKVCAGGCVFEFADEWWKAGDPGSHDTGGWYTNNCPDGYASEEWWGLVGIDRTPRLAYQLFKEYFGGLIPEPPPSAEESNVVRFSTQPDTITTNIQTYVINDVFDNVSSVTLNGAAITLDHYKGFSKDVTLTTGSNNFTLYVVFTDSTEKTYNKTVVYDPGYSTADKKMLYVNDVAIDLDVGALIGRLPAQAVAITNNGRYIVDANGNVYSTANNKLTGPKLNLGTGPHYPLFSNDDNIIYSKLCALNFTTNTVITNNLPLSVMSDTCKIDANGNIFCINQSNVDYSKNEVKEMEPTVFGIVKDFNCARTGFYFCNSGMSRDGSLAVAASCGGAEGNIDIIDVATGAIVKTHNGLSDWTGDCVSSYDNSKIFVGSYGNAYYGGGNIYVIDAYSKDMLSSYHQFGARRLAVSPENIFSTSTILDFNQDGTRVYGSKYHRGIEVFTLDANSQLVYQKSYFLALADGYSMLPVKILYKKNY